MRAMLALALILGLGVGCLGGDGVRAYYAVWTESSLKKVLKTDAVKPLGPASIKAARNEHEAFQIVIKAGRVGLQDVTVTAGGPVSEKGKIAASNLTLYSLAYVFLPKLIQHYPDPLPPLRQGFSAAPGHTQPVWVDVYVPKDAKPGDYSGLITIAPANGRKIDVPFTVHVYDFELPVESKMATAFGLTISYVAAQHGVKADSPEAKALHKSYYELLLGRGISTYEVPADVFTEEGAKYLRDPRLTSFVIDYTTDEPRQRKILDRIRSLGVWDKGFFYFLDEPVNQEAYKKLQGGCDYLRKIDPKVNIISPYFRNPDFGNDKTVYDLLAGYINIWCFNTGFYDARALDVRRKAGDVIWDYVCCGPGEPHANFFVQYAPIQHRILMWQNYLNQVTGLLYWCTTYWAETKHPWENMATWGGLYGDGSLLYPGKKVGIDGPVSSIRLETIRDGLDDCKYLWLLERKIGREGVLPYVRKLTTSWTEFSRDPVLFESVRDEIAGRIETL